MPPSEPWTAFAAEHPRATPGQLIEQAIQEGRTEVVLGILQNTDVDINRACDPQRYGSVSPLMTALRAGNARIVSLIARQPRFDLARSLPKYERWSWIRTASLEVLDQYLSIRGADVNQPDGNGKTLLHEVVYDLGSQDKLRHLLSQPGIMVDAKQADGTSPLYRAGLAGNGPAFTLLLEQGADVNNRNNDNRWTILISAVAENHTNIVEQALARPEIDINAGDDLNNTALHIAAERGQTQMVEFLLENPKIEINPQNHTGLTPLSKAAFGGHAEIVRRLLARPELEVNLVDQYRQTPLFHAASTGSIEVVRLLLADARTNSAITNRPARLTAYDMAISLGFNAVAEAIREHAGDRDALSPGDPWVELPVQPRRFPFMRPPRKSS